MKRHFCLAHLELHHCVVEIIILLVVGVGHSDVEEEVGNHTMLFLCQVVPRLCNYSLLFVENAYDLTNRQVMLDSF